ncbi:MAG: hypothetical protein U1A77_05495 [Pirellulales bacterium]
MDRDSLTLRIDSLIRRSRIWSVTQAGADWFSATVGAILLCGALDYSVRFQDHGMRFLVSIAWLLLTLWTARRFFLPVLRASHDPLVVAQRLERSFPQLRGLLAAAIDFQRQGELDSGAGSLQLRESVVKQATSLARELDFGQVLDFRGPRRALGIAAVIAWAGLTLAAIEPLSAGLVIQRLANPWNEAAWPRRHRLKLERPPVKVAAGQDVELAVIDESGQAPDKVTFYWHYQDEMESQGVQRTVAPTANRAVIRVERPLRPFRIRAAGGDDDSMPWFDVGVIEPPVVVLSEAVIVAPEYTGEKPRPIGQPARAWVSSKIRLQGQASRPLAFVSVRRLDRGEDLEAEGQLTEDGLSFHLGGNAGREWVVRDSGTFVLDVTDRDGVKGEVARWVVEAVADSPPTLSLISPPMLSQSTSRARVMLRGVAKDDIGLRKVELRYRLVDASHASDDSTTSITLLDASPDQRKSTADSVPATGPLVYRMADDRFNIDTDWEMGDHERIQAGVTVELRIAATDSAGQVRETEPRRIEIVTPEELAQRLSRRETVLLDQIRESLRLQREAWARTKQVAEAAQGRSPNPKDADQLQGVELTQRAITRMLVDEQTGVLPHMSALIAEYRGNRLESGTAVARLEEIGGKLRGVAEADLPAVERDLLHTVRALREAMREFQSPLDEAIGGQQKVVETLEQIVGRLAPWELLHRQSGEIAEARRGIESVREETERLLTQATDSSSPASPAVRDSLRKALAERQFEWARRLERAFAEIAAAGEVENADQRLGQAVKQAMEVVRRTTPAASLRQAGQATTDNRLGAASEAQQSSLESLAELLQVMARSTGMANEDQTNASGSRATRDLDEWRTAVEDLIVRQAEVVERITTRAAHLKDGKPMPKLLLGEDLAEQQDGVRRRSDDQLALLPDMPAFRFALRGAVAQMRDAAQSLREDLVEQSLELSHNALRRLEQLRDVARESSSSSQDSPDSNDQPRTTPPSQRPGERSSKLSLADLALVREIQAELRERTTRIEASRGGDGMLAPMARRELEMVAREQGELAQLLGELVE